MCANRISIFLRSRDDWRKASVIGKERVHARPGNPCRLRIGQRDFFRRLALAIAARTVAVWVAMHLIIAQQCLKRRGTRELHGTSKAQAPSWRALPVGIRAIIRHGPDPGPPMTLGKDPASAVARLAD